MLTNNAIASLAALVPLESLIHLKHLSLRGNPVTQHEHYREFTVWKVSHTTGPLCAKTHARSQKVDCGH